MMPEGVPIDDAACRRAVQQHASQGQLAQARAVIQGAFTAGLITANLLSDLGALQTLQGDLGTAEKSLRLALQLQPGHFQARRNLAELLLLTHRHAEAVAMIRGLLPSLPPADQVRLRPHVQVHDRAIEPWSPADKRVSAIWEQARRLPGLTAKEWQIDLDAFQRFSCAHPWSAAPHYYEKKLQYYLSAAALQLTAADRYVDVASQGSVFPGYVRRMVGCDVYQQDLLYPPGRHHCLTGNAAEMPVEDGFFTAITLHCSFEHFEGDSDIRFIREAARVLRPGGRICIVPLYLGLEHEERYHKAFANGEESKALGPGCEFYRGYSPQSLLERVAMPAQGSFAIELYRMANLDRIGATLPRHQILLSHFMLRMTRL